MLAWQRSSGREKRPAGETVTASAGSTWLRLIRAARNHYRRAGLRVTLWRGIRRYVIGRTRVVILVSSTAGPEPARVSDGITIRHVEKRPGRWRCEAMDGDRVVGYRTAVRQYAGSGILETLVLEPDQAYAVDLFVAPAYRNRHIGLRLSVGQDRYLGTQGIREVVSGIHADNLPSLRVALRKGARPVRVLTEFRCLLYRRRATLDTLPADLQQLYDEVRSSL